MVHLQNRSASAAPSPAAAEKRPGRGLKQQILREAKRLGASVVGFAPTTRWPEHDEIPRDYRPDSIWPQARTVIVFGVPMLLPVIETTPSINYQEHYDTSNRLLDEISFRLAVWLTERGLASLSLPRDGYGSLEVLLRNPFASFSHTYAAKYAGLGTVGMSHNLLTLQWGPRIRLNSVFTAAIVEADDEQPRELCSPACRMCERACPVGAIAGCEGQVIGRLDKDACTRHHIALKSETRWPCGICVKVCPVGTDRRLFEARQVKPYLEERAALAADPDDPRFRRLAHIRRHGSGGDRIA